MLQQGALYPHISLQDKTPQADGNKCDRHHHPSHKHILNQSDKQHGRISSPPRDTWEQKHISFAESELEAETKSQSKWWD